MPDIALRLLFERAEWRMLFWECEQASLETARVIAEMEALLAEVWTARAQREVERRMLVDVLVGPDGRARFGA